MTNGLQIKTAVLSQAVDRFIIKIKIKHYNKLSNRIMIKYYFQQFSLCKALLKCSYFMGYCRW
jgi:hypothetical protein